MIFFLQGSWCEFSDMGLHFHNPLPFLHLIHFFISVIHSKFCFAGPLSGSLGLCLWSICIRLGIIPQNLPRVLNRSVSRGCASLAVRCICIRRGDPGMLQIRDQDRAWDSAFPGCSQGRCIIAPGPEPSSEEQEFRG